jgi:hypothetical protein
MSLVEKTLTCKSDHTGFFGVSVTPNFSVSQSALVFALTMLREISAAQTLLVSGSGLLNPVIVTAPAGFIINTDNSNTNQSPISLAPSLGVVNATVYVKYAPTLYQPYSANITATSTGLTTLNTSVDGTTDLQATLKSWYNALTGAKPVANILYALQGVFLVLDSSGQLGNVDLLHILVGMATAEQRTNAFINSANAAFTLNGTYVYDNTGFRGDGSSGYLGLSWNANGNGVQYQKDDSSAFLYVASGSGYGGSGSAQSTRGNSYIYPRKVDGKAYFSLNNTFSGGDDSIGVAANKGFYCVKRSGANAVALQKDGAVIATSSIASANRNNIEDFLGAINTSSGTIDFSDHKYCLVGRGNSNFDDNLMNLLLVAYAAEIGISI